MQINQSYLIHSTLTVNQATLAVTYADSGQALSANQETIQAGIWAVEKHIQSFTDELKLSKELFEGNTLTLGGYYAHVKDHDVWNLGNNVLLALEPQARVLNATLEHDLSRPDGTPRKLMSNAKLAAMGWSPSISLPEGLKSTYEWFLAHRA